MRLLIKLFKYAVILMAGLIVLSLFMGGVGLLLGLIRPIIIVVLVFLVLRFLFRSR